MSKREFKALGQIGAVFEGLETLAAPLGLAMVEYVSDEVTALCPVTNQPDQYEVNILIKEPSTIIESKSLKLYVQSFRNMGIFAESFADRIADEVYMAVHPCDWVEVRVIQKPRGGITIVATARREQM